MKTITIKDARIKLTKDEKINYIYEYINAIFYKTSKTEVLDVLMARLGTEQGIIEFYAYYEGFSKSNIDDIFNYLMDELEEVEGDQYAKITI